MSTQARIDEMFDDPNVTPERPFTRFEYLSSQRRRKMVSSMELRIRRLENPVDLLSSEFNRV